MPVLKVKHIVSFSSEDEKHPADNILKPETYYKWKCANGGESNATIVLQLEKATQISGIDIGNNGSAFIEVLVGRSTWSQSEEFQVLLVASSFMTPADSKSGKDINRVRMFGLENLNKSVASEKWDQVKIFCTQPYNLNDQYGLSFIKLYSPTEQDDQDKDKIINCGRFNFKLKHDDDDDSNPPLAAGSFFQRRMNIPVVPTVASKMSMAASARSNDPSPRTGTIFKAKVEEVACEKKISISEDRRQEVASALLKGAAERPNKESTTHSWDKISVVDLNNSTKKNVDNTKRKFGNEKKQDSCAVTPPNKKQRDSLSQASSSQAPSSQVSETNKSIKSKNIPKHVKIKIKRKNVAYNKILEGVVFAISGYQNPERGNIRDLALLMGAKYEPSWGDKCTHLICAFANTPKYREVIGKGKIVRKKWIYECDKANCRLNSKDFRLDGGGDSSYESSGNESVENTDSTSATHDVKNKSELDDKKVSSDDIDTEDELEKIREHQKRSVDVPDSLCNQEEEDAYQLSTDESEGEIESNPNKTPISNMSGSTVKKSFFADKHFFFYGDFDAKDRNLLKRYITDYSGTVCEYMKDSVNFVISLASWDHNFQEALGDNSSLIFVQPKWIFKCHEKQEFIPYENYEIKSS